MTESSPLGSTAILATLGYQPEQRQLLQAIVETGRAVFAAEACSVFLVEPDGAAVTFEAVSGRGEKELTGTRIPVGRGIVGWVTATAQPLIVDDVAGDSLFDLDFAKSTGFVPRSIAAAPLLIEGEAVGVIEVLDRTCGHRGSLSDLELLTALATQAATAVQIVRRARAAQLAAQGDGAYREVVELLDILDRLDPAQRSTVGKLLRTLSNLCNGG